MNTTLDRAPTLEDFCNAANDLYAAPTEERFYAVVNLARESLILRGQAWDEGFAFGTSQFEPMPVAWMTFGACTGEPVFCTTPPDDDNVAGWVPVYRRMVPNAALEAEPPKQEAERDWSTAQDWKGMDGAIAWHLIDRHADGWDDVGAMMNAWLAAQAEPQGWRPISEAPKDGRSMLLGYPNRAGKWRTVRGQWFSDAEIAETWEEEGDEGWYETSVECEDLPNCWPIEPTHWMPLPATPPKD